MLLLNGLRSWLLALVIVVVVAGAALSAAAGAAPYGELTNFGSAGVGAGQFTEEGPATAAFGVDPTDNTVYVGDKPSNKVFRIQKFSSTGTLLGEARIESVPGESALEGVAVDPVEKRFYALIVQTRSPEATFDPEFTAAGALYAFSTEPTEEAGKKVLLPAVPGGVLAGKSVLKPASTVAGEALLEPSGIAVDPKSHDIILAGTEDPTGSEEPLTALERVSKTGVLGARWVDKESSRFFGEEIGTSPVVTPEGKVYVVGGAVNDEGEQIDEIPANFASEGTPKTFIKYDSGELELVSFPGIPAALEGGGLSLAPDGTLWVYAKILSPGEGKHPGALSFSTSGTPAVLGWTGGQTLKLGTGKCVISFFGHPMVAAGKEDQLFMFDSDSSAPKVIKFGPGGEGCPTAKATTPLEAFVGAVKEEPSDLIAPGSEVKLSSTIAEANALTVEWNFGDGSPVVVTSDQHQTPTTLHKYTTEGPFKVTATIQTDNRASPTIVLERTLTVSKPLPIAKFTASTPVLVGQVDAFDAKGSSGVEKAAISEYKWNFGDGSPAVVTTTPSTTHTFATEGEFKVTLQVVDAHKLTSNVASAGIKVNPVPVITPPPTTTTGTTAPPGETGVLPYKLSVPAGSLTASKSGALALKIDCAGQSSCTGTATLKTASAVSAGKHKKKTILTLASGSFKVLGGHLQAITLHLSAAARTLLAHSGTRGLRVTVTILAHDAAGVAHPMTAQLTIHAAKVKKHH